MTYVEINQCVRCTNKSSLSHFPAMTRLFWLGRAVRNRHRHAIEQASHRWRGGRRDDSARSCREILISTQVMKVTWDSVDYLNENAEQTPEPEGGPAPGKPKAPVRRKKRRRKKKSTSSKKDDL